MDEINVGLTIGVPLASGVLAFATSWGYLKGEKKIFMDHPAHREICHEKSVELHTKIDEYKKEVSQQTQEIMRAIGRIEGKLEGMK